MQTEVVHSEVSCALRIHPTSRSSSRKSSVPVPPGDQDDLGVREVLEGGGRLDAQHCVVVADHARLVGPARSRSRQGGAESTSYGPTASSAVNLS